MVGVKRLLRPEDGEIVGVEIFHEGSFSIGGSLGLTNPLL